MFVRNVTGLCLDVLRHFLFLLPATRDWNALLQQPAEFFLDNSFAVTGKQLNEYIYMCVVCLCVFRCLCVFSSVWVSFVYECVRVAVCAR